MNRSWRSVYELGKVRMNQLFVALEVRLQKKIIKRSIVIRTAAEFDMKEIRTSTRKGGTLANRVIGNKTVTEVD